jgi:hypothetical protein
MQQEELTPLEIYLNKRIKDIKSYLKANERSEDEKGFPPSEELQICYLAKRALEQEKASHMTSIKTLESVKSKLTPDEYNSIANDIVLLARIWYACTSISNDEIIIDRVRDDGSIAKFVNTERKDLEKCLKN